MPTVAVAGASGYMGAELLRLLTVHPKLELTAVTSERLSGERLDHFFPHLRGLSDLTFQELDAARLAEQADVVFLALPHMESQRAVPVLREPWAQGDRPLRRLPAARRLALCHVVQGRARRRRGPQGRGVRDAGAASEGDRGRLARGLAGLLSHGSRARRGSLARARMGPTGRDRDRREVRRDGSRSAGAQGRRHVSRTPRRTRTFRRTPSPATATRRRSSRSSPGSPGRRSW